jgi:hypothetical protein
MADIDCVAVPASSSVPSLNYIFDLKGGCREALPPRQAVMETLREWLKQPGLKPPLSFIPFPSKETMPIVRVNRHLAHPASVYCTSHEGVKVGRNRSLPIALTSETASGRGAVRAGFYAKPVYAIEKVPEPGNDYVTAR